MVGSSSRCSRLWLIPVLLAAALATRAHAQAPAPAPDPAAAERQKAFDSIKWTLGPGKAGLGTEAELQIPAGLKFTGREGTQKMLELMRNPSDGSDLGMLTTEDLAWFVLFDFSDIGYVKDADKEKLDATEMLTSIREGNEQANEARKERGWPPIKIVGWHTPPFYNQQTNNLEWCIKGESEGHTIVNYNTRILGRGGVMSANLLVDPGDLDRVLPEVRKILGGFAFVAGQRYAEWRAGDKVAKYGLSALVVGGAVGAAAKLGLLSKLGVILAKAWKALLVGLFAIGAGIKRLFTRRRDPAPMAPPPTEPPSDPPPAVG